MSRHYTEAEKDEAKRLWASGLSLKNAAKQIGCSLEAIKSWRKSDLTAWNDAREEVSSILKEKIQESAAQIIPELVDRRLGMAKSLITTLEEEVAVAESALTPKERNDSLTIISKLNTLLNDWGMMDLLKQAMMREAANSQALSREPEAQDDGPELVE